MGEGTIISKSVGAYAPASSWRRVFRVNRRLRRLQPAIRRTLPAVSSTSPIVADALQAELAARADRIRPASYVMRPDVLGAARLSRYSFSRTLLRRAVG